jgi:hypothetical protein
MALIGSVDTEDVLKFIGKAGNVIFTREIAKVVLGSCANGEANRHDPEIGCSTVVGSHEMNLAFWRHHLDGVKGNVLIVTECCGQYSPAQLDALQNEFPEINFITPYIKDFCDRFEWKGVLPDLLKANLIRLN